MLRVQVVSGAYADDVTRRLRKHDNTGLLAVTMVERPGLAAIVITAKHGRSMSGSLTSSSTRTSRLPRRWTG